MKFVNFRDFTIEDCENLRLSTLSSIHSKTTNGTKTYTAAKDLQNYIDIETNWYEVEI